MFHVDNMNTFPSPHPVPLESQGCAKCASPWPIDVKVKKLNTSDSITGWQIDDTKDVKKQKLRKKLKQWWKKASQENSVKSNQSSALKRAITDATNYAACPDRDYVALISAAIRHSPTGKRSTTGICKDIMKSHEWYRSNRRSGWQEAIAAELMGNPLFQPVVECRKGAIIKNKSVKWQLKRQKELSTTARCDSTCVSRPQSLVSSPVVAELPAIPSSRTTGSTHVDYDTTEKIKGLDRALSTSAPSISPLSIRTTSSPPHYSAIQSASSEIGSLASARRGSPASLRQLSEKLRSSSPAPKTSSSRVTSWMHDTAPWTSYKPSLAETLSQAETIPCSMDPASIRIQENRGIELFDPPMKEGSYFEHAQQDNNGNSSSSSSPTDQQQNTTTASSPDATPARQTAHGNSGSRKSDANEGFSDDDDGNQGRKRKRFRSSARNQNKRKFACVYHKYDPVTYGVQNRRYLVCAGTGFEYTSELVRHLARNHGEYVCGNCIRSFESEELSRAHKQECTVRLRCSQEERWAALWRARFPGVPVPQDPYLEVSEKPTLPLLDTGVGLLSVPAETGQGISASSCQTISPSTVNGSSSPSTTSHLPADCSTPATSTGSTNDCGTQFTNNLKLMEDRVDHLEKKLPFFEEALGCMFKMMASMEAVKQNAEGIAAPQGISPTPPFDSKLSQTSTLQPPMTPTSKGKGPCSCGNLSPGNEASLSNIASPSDMFTDEALEGDTLTPKLGQEFLNEFLRKSTSPSGPGCEISDLIEMSNNDFLDRGKIVNNELDLMDLSADPDPDCDSANGKHPRQSSLPSVELLVDVYS